MCPQPIKEEYLLSGYLEPTNEGYAIAKISGLKMCQFFKREYGDNFISCMPTIDKFLGYGFGKGIYVGEFSYLVMPGSHGTIPVLHNGYYTMLIKNGIVGLILYLSFYFTNIKTAIRYIKNKQNMYEAKFQIGILLALMTLTYFVTGIVSKSGYFVFCLLIGYICSNIPIEENVNSYSDASR